MSDHFRICTHRRILAHTHPPTRSTLTIDRCQTCDIKVGFFKKALDKVISNQVFLLQVIAINEVMLMPIIIITVLTGGGNIFLPFVYYRFIFLRYSSARNPYSKFVVF